MLTTSLSTIHLGVFNLKNFIGNSSIDTGRMLKLVLSKMLATPYTTLIIPPGEYDLSDETAAYVLSGNNHSIVCPDGVAKLNFGGNPGFEFSDGDQSDWLFKNIEFVNFSTAIGVVDNISSYMKMRKNITFDSCKFNSVNQSGKIKGIFLKSRVQNIKLLNSEFTGIHSTDNSVVAVTIGLKGDGTTRGISSSTDYDYSENGTVGSAEGEIWIINNKLQNITSTPVGNTEDTREVKGVVVDGWRAFINKNIFDTIHNNTNSADNKGLVTRVHNGTVSDNQFIDAGKYCFVSHNGGKSTTYGDVGTVTYTGNTYRSRIADSVLSPFIFRLEGPGAKLFNETFIEVDPLLCIVQGVPGSDDCVVQHSKFIRCKANMFIELQGDRCVIDNNKAIDPRINPNVFNQTYAFFCWKGTSNTACTELTNNLLVATPQWNITGSTYVVMASTFDVVNSSNKNVTIKNNNAVGIDGTLSTYTFNLIYPKITTNTSVGWRIIDNKINSGSTIRNANIRDIVYTGPSGEVPLQDIIIKNTNDIPYQYSSNITIKKGESGAWFVADGNVTTTATLPPAIPGLSYLFTKLPGISNMILAVSTGNMFAEGTTNGSLTATTPGDIHIRCRDIGIWEIASSSALYGVN